MEIRRGFVGALAALAALGLAPATAAPAVPVGAPAQPRVSALAGVDVPAGALTATRGGDGWEFAVNDARVEDLLLRAVEPGDPRTFPDALRAHLAATTGLDLPDLRPEHSAGHEDEPEAEPEEIEGTFAYASPVGDLSGDGLDDVLTYEVTLPEERILTRALTGTDGAELWALDLTDTADAVGFPAGDLDGDGAGDLVLASLRILTEHRFTFCRRGGCWEESRSTYEWTVGGRSGRDGRLLWSQAYPGREHSRYRFNDDDFEANLDATNVAVLPFASDDHDGDGGLDLVVDALDVRLTAREERDTTLLVLAESSGEFQLRATTRAAVVSGASGAPIATRTAEEAPRIALLVPSGQLVGDATGDLLWEATVFTDSSYHCRQTLILEECDDPVESFSVAHDLEAIDGATFLPAWRAAEAGFLDVFAFPLDADLDGDGAGELVRLEVHRGDRFFFRTTVLAGATGAPLWAADDAHFFPFPVVAGTYDDALGADLLFATFLFEDDDPGAITVELSRVDGVTGAPLFATRRVLRPVEGTHDETFGFAFVAPLGDTDGDGRDDVDLGALAEAFDYEFAPLDGGFSETRTSGSVALVESAATGDEIHAFRREGFALLDPADDLDGDGRADVFDVTFPEDYFDEDAQRPVTGLRLSPAAPLWTLSLEVFSEDLITAGDQDGAAGAELLLSELTVADSRASVTVTSLSGATAAPRWSFTR
jgi:hypothetical protein